MLVHCACAVSAGPDVDDVAPNAGGVAEALGPVELEERCWTVETTMRRMLIRNRRLTYRGGQFYWPIKSISGNNWIPFNRGRKKSNSLFLSPHSLTHQMGGVFIIPRNQSIR